MLDIPKGDGKKNRKTMSVVSTVDYRIVGDEEVFEGITPLIVNNK